MSLLAGTRHALTRLVAPSRCAACDAPVGALVAFCPPCAVTIVRLAPERPRRLAAFAYGGAIAQAVRRLKFDDRPDLAPALLAGVRPLLPDLRAQAPSLVVPVPLHPSRLVERGYNQAALLARPIAGWLAVACATRCLERVRATGRQTELSRDARSENVAGAFRVRVPAEVAGQVVLVVDDVETTGATLGACADALRLAGATTVVTLAIARAEADAASARVDVPRVAEKDTR